MKRISEEDLSKIFELHKEGKTSRQIGKEIGRHWNTVGYRLIKNG